MRRNAPIVDFDDAEVLDFAGPLEVFAVTDEPQGHAAFRVMTAAPVRARNGPKVAPDLSIGDCPRPHVPAVPRGFVTRALLRNCVIKVRIQVMSCAAEMTMGVGTGRAPTAAGTSAFVPRGP